MINNCNDLKLQRTSVEKYKHIIDRTNGEASVANPLPQKGSGILSTLSFPSSLETSHAHSCIPMVKLV